MWHQSEGLCAMFSGCMPSCLSVSYITPLSEEKNWEHSGQEGIREYLLFRNSGNFPPEKQQKPV